MWTIIFMFTKTKICILAVQKSVKIRDKALLIKSVLKTFFINAICGMQNLLSPQFLCTNFTGRPGARPVPNSSDEKLNEEERKTLEHKVRYSTVLKAVDFPLAFIWTLSVCQVVCEQELPLGIRWG